MTNKEWKKKNNFKEDTPICENCKYFDYKIISKKDGDDRLPICTLMPDKEHNLIDATSSSCNKFKQIWFKINTEK
jgi:hypothetical protein